MRSEKEQAPTTQDRIYRCSAGHLYSADSFRATWYSLHLGPGRHWQRCPVGRHFRMAYRVHADDLTAEQLEQARKYQF